MTDTEQTAEPDGKDDKLAERHGFVDFDKIDDPETRKQVQDRIHSLYQSRQETAAAFEESRRMYGAMEKKLADLEAKQGEKESEAQLTEIRKGITEAQSKGDYETATALNEKLVDAKIPKRQPDPEPNDNIPREQAQMLFAWQSEMTDDGRFERPWAHKTNRRYSETISQLAEVTDDPEFKAKGFGAILAEVDRRMKPAPKQTAPVSDGDATVTRTSTKTVQLTEGQKRAAIRLYSHMKPVEAIKAYTEAQKKYGAE